MSQDQCVCCAGPQGPQGIPGVQGPQGNQGPRGASGAVGAAGAQGLQGVAGLDGAEGPIGPMGPQGVQGPQGIPGDCVACPGSSASSEFAEVYSSVAQVLAPSTGPNLPGQVVTLENTIYATANIDVSQAGTNGQVTINLAGWYDIATGICGFLNSLSSPLPVWTLSLFKNGVLIPGSTFANQTISPEQQSNEVVADVFVHCNAGDVITLASSSTNPVSLVVPTLGTNAQPNSCYMKIILLKAD